jgi:uncharacterized protein (UPF0261 family)
MPKTIVIPATLDTKGEEVQFLKKEIEKKGHKTLVIDVGILGQPWAEANITREEVAEAGGRSLKELVEAAERGTERVEATNVMTAGLKEIVQDLHAEGRLDAILSLGGSTGTAIATAAMSVLPVGVPKLMVSTWFDTRFIGAKDVAILQTPADILGLNEVMRKTLASAAGAIVGMAEAHVEASERPMVGITALGVTTPAVMNILPLLNRGGYDPLVFHAKTEVLDELIEEDRIRGIIDLTTFEVLIPIAFHLPEALSEARLALAGERGLPQVIVPGGLDMFIFPGTREAVPPEYSDRPTHAHGPDRMLVRTRAKEVEAAARLLSARANRACGPVAVVIPLQGFSSVDREGDPFHDPEADGLFSRVIEENVEETVQVCEVDAHINDPVFAEEVVEVFLRMAERGGV